MEKNLKNLIDKIPLLIENFDIFSFLDTNSIDYSTKGKNIGRGWIGLDCPFCGDSSNHFGWNLKQKNYSCWVCGEKGNTIVLIRRLLKCGFYDALEVLSSHQSAKLIIDDDIPLVPHGTNIIPSQATKGLLPRHREYLIERNFNPDEIEEKYHLYSCHTYGFYKHSIIIPIIYNREIVSFTSRDITGMRPSRYISCPLDKSIISIKETLYGIDEVNESCVVVEGPFDKWRIGDGVVASMSKVITRKQILQLIEKKVKNIFILFDSEAKVRANYTANLLSLTGQFKSVEILDIDCEEPEFLSKEDVDYIRKEFIF